MKKDGIKEKSFFLFLLLLQALLMAAALIYCRARYEVSDDFVMELILTGAFDGQPDPHMMFSSFLWGKLLLVFMKIFAGVNWYLAGQMLTVFLTFVCLSVFLVRRKNWAAAVFFLSVLHLYFGQDLYLLLQFTKIAAAAIAAGGGLYIWNLFHEKEKSLSLLGGGTLLLGCLIRHYALLAAGSFLFVYAALEFIKLLVRKKRDSFPEVRRILSGMVLLGALVLGLRAVNNLSYSLSPAYKEYMDYSYLRSAILDGRLPDYEDCREDFEEAGISENSYVLIRRWCFADRTYFTPERMKRAGEVIKKWRRENPPEAKDLWETYRERETDAYPAARGLLFLAAAGAFLSPWVLPAGLAGWILTKGLSLYLLWRGHMVYRVEFGLMFSQAVLLLFSMDMGGWRLSEKWKDKLIKALPCRPGPLGTRRIRAAFRTAVLLSAFGLFLFRLPSLLPDRKWESLSGQEYTKEMDRVFYASWDYAPDKYTAMTKARTIRPAFLEEVRSHPENLYLMDFGTSIQSYYYDFDPLFPLESGSFSNTIYLGGVTVNHPSVDRALAEWGLEEALPGLLKENVYLVSNNTQDQILEYLRTFYDSSASAVREGEYDGYTVWSFRTGT